MKLTIEVTQEDIDEGCKLDTTGKSGGCMVWRAFNRCTKGAFPYFRVNYDRIITYFDWEQMFNDMPWGMKYDKEFLLPDGLDKLINGFDHGLPVQPFSFEIDITETAYGAVVS